MHSLVRLCWFKEHVKKDVCGKPVTVWEHDIFETHNFRQISHIKAKTVSLVEKLDDTYDTVLFVSPLLLL